jgi:hypothetical protein
MNGESMAEERLWCTACGTVTRDNRCDCNKWQNEMSREPQFVNYADAMQEAAHEQAQEVERLRKGIQDYLDGNFGPDFPTKHDTCPHKKFGWEDCGQCIDEHFTALLAAGDN